MQCLPTIMVIRQVAIIFLIAVLMVKSNHQPHLHDKHLTLDYLTRFPQALYFISEKKQKYIVSLPDSSLESMAKYQDLDIITERIKRLIQKKQQDLSFLLIAKYIQSLSAEQYYDISDLLFQSTAVNTLKNLSKLKPLPEKIATLLAMSEGELPQNLNYNALDKIGINSLNSQPLYGENCEYKVLLLSDRYKNVRQLEKLKVEYEKKPEPLPDIYCLSKVYYIGDLSHCSLTQNKFAHCNFHIVEDVYKQYISNSDYIILLTDKGKANVRGRKMTLTSLSNYNILVHELMHFAGFEDEYILPKEKADWLCNKAKQVAPNLYVGDKNSAPEGWVESHACKHGQFKAFKPTGEMSIMNYSELAISSHYRKMWINTLIIGERKLTYLSGNNN